MKRVIAWVLILTLCLGLFAGCKKDKENQNPTTGEATGNVADLEAALEYIKTVYRKPSEKTPKDFQRIGVVPVNGKEYEVVWTADVGEEYIKVVKGTDGMVTIDVNETVEADVKYVLTATISDGGSSVSHSWNHILPAPNNDMVAIVEEAYKLESGKSMDYEVTLTGKITAINTPWDPSYKNITVTIVVEGAEDKPIQCYRLAGEGAENLKPNDIITVTGTLKNYNGTIEFDAGCTLDAVIEGEEIKAPEDPKQILKEAYALAEGGALPYEATLSGVITKVNTEYNPQYKNVTVTMVVGGDNSKPVQCYRLAGDGADKIGKGDSITVTGWIVNYKGTVQFGAGCKLDKWSNTGKDEPKPEDTFTTTLVPEIVTAPKAGTAYKFFMYQKNYDKNFYLTGKMDGFYYETTYDPAKGADVYVEEVSGGYRLYFLDNGTKTYLQVERAIGTDGKYHNNVVFTTKPTAVMKWNAAIKSFTTTLNVDGQDKDFYLGTYSFYKTFSASEVSRITGSDADKMDTENFVGRLATMKETAVQEQSAAEKAYLALKDEYFVASDAASVTTEDYTRKNVYEVDGKKIKVEWTENSNAVAIVDNGNGTVTVKVTRGEADAEYTLTATITDGDKKYTASWKCVVPAVPPVSAKDIVDAAYALQPGESMADKVTLSGIIANIDTAYSEQYGNITVTIVVEDMMDKPIMCYRMKGEGIADLVGLENITVTGIIKNYNGTIEFDAGCTMDACMTQEEIVDAAYALEDGKVLEQKYTLIGEVISVDTPYSEQYGNITVTMAVPGCEDQPIQCYRLSGSGAELLDVGYQVAVYGTLKNYKGTYEFDQGCVLVDYSEPNAEIPTLTIPEANALGAAQADNVYTDEVYVVSGTVTEIANATYGNLYITDAAGNELYIYGLNDAEGNRFDALAVKPAVGDVLSVVGKLGQYKGTPQMKNAVIGTHIPVLTIPAANELGAGLSADTEVKYMVSGIVSEIANETYGNIYIEDTEGNKLYVYGLYNADGSVRFDAMEQKPAVGDIITVYGVMSQYKGSPQMKNAWMVEHMAVATLPDANTIGAAVADNKTTEIKYLVTGVVTEIANATYGNIYIEDAEGNKLYIYGLYDAIGNLRYDAMEQKPAVGDTIAVYGVLCQYKGTAQMKNGWMLAHAAANPGPQPEEPEVLALSIPEANSIGAAQADNVYTEQQYQVTGFVTEIANATYGNIYIEDAEGNKFYIYGLNDAEGNRFDAMAVMPQVGDLITVVGGLGQYRGAPQMKNGVMVSHVQALTIPAANELGAGLTADSEAKYLVTGIVTEIANETYGNIYIEDAEGNKLYVYGVYNADGTVRYDAMEQKPAVGDTVTLYGVMSQYKGSPQMKNGWVLVHTLAETEEDET